MTAPLTRLVEAPLQLYVVVGMTGLGGPAAFHDFAVAYTEAEATAEVQEYAARAGHYGGMMAIMARFDAQQVLERIERHRPQLPKVFARDYTEPAAPPAATPEAARPYRELTMLIRDRFAQTALERKVLDAIAERIPKT